MKNSIRTNLFIFAMMIICCASCTNVIKSNRSVVTSVSEMIPYGSGLYEVTIVTDDPDSRFDDVCSFNTNVRYNVGDTIKLCK